MSGAPAMTSTLPTPGTYLRLRREAQGLSIEDVAAFVRTVPHLDLHGRCTLLRGIEADLTPISDDVIGSLMRAADEQGSFRFDPEVLVRLIDIAAGDTSRTPPDLCRRCACSAHDACFPVAGDFTTACVRVEPGLCTACVGSTDDQVMSVFAA